MENYSTLSRDSAFRKKSIFIVLVALLGMAALYGIIYSVENFFGGTQTGGVSGSSYASIETGTRAWSELLASNSYTVSRDRGRVSLPELSNIEPYSVASRELSLDRLTKTVVVLGGALPSDEAGEVKEYVSSGGRLITDNPYLLNDLLGSRIKIQIEGSTNLFVQDTSVDGLEGIKNVQGSGAGLVRFKQSEKSMPLVNLSKTIDHTSKPGESKSDIASSVIFRLGNGDVIAMPDSGIVSNQNLPLKDNALFSIRIAGATGSRVTFVEGVHGYSDVSGFAGMPLSWRIGIVGLFVAFVVFGTAKGRRFGVGEEPDRNLGPRRIYFAHAIAMALKKSKR